MRRFTFGILAGTVLALCWAPVIWGQETTKTRQAGAFTFYTPLAALRLIGIYPPQPGDPERFVVCNISQTPLVAKVEWRLKGAPADAALHELEAFLRPGACRVQELAGEPQRIRTTWQTADLGPRMELGL